MFAKTFLLFELFLLFQVISAKKPLPKYVKGCSLKDPNLEKCMLDSAIEVIPNILHGDKEYKIPSIAPLSVKAVDINHGTDLSIKLHDVKAYGIENIDVKSIKHNIKDKELQVEFLIPLLNITGNYEIHGRILILPIEGNGYMEIVPTGCNFHAKLTYKLIDKNGENYVRFSKDDSKLTADFKNIKFRLDNLFNGDKTLGEQTNKFLNENWQEAAKELLPAILEVVNTILLEILNNLTDEIPADDIFLP